VPFCGSIPPKRYRKLPLSLDSPRVQTSYSFPKKANSHERSTRLQKLFSAFPSGAPGLGLLLLRGFVALTLVVQGLAYLNSGDFNLLRSFVAALAFIVGGCLLIGFLTPLIAVIVCGGAIISAISPAHLPAESVVGVTILAAAIALLGPGAFSLDARLFGRREIVIPNISHKTHK
jgi:uncharacterized membrane protein YphA (DoxX/SURF4 family)